MIEGSLSIFEFQISIFRTENRVLEKLEIGEWRYFSLREK